MLGCIAVNTGFSAAEIECFDHSDVTFWWNAIMAWRQEEAKASE